MGEAPQNGEIKKPQILAQIFFYALVFSTLISTASAVSCDGDFSNIKATEGEWSFHPISCSALHYDAVLAVYSGNLTNRTEVIVEPLESSGSFRIGLLFDARNLGSGDYTGKVNVFGDGSKILSFDAHIRVGKGKTKEISLSKDSLTFTPEDFTHNECYELKVRNTGNVVLNNMEASIRDWSGRCEWLNISDISRKEFKVGEKTSLWVCVNARDNCTRWEERDTVIRIETDELTEELVVNLLGNQRSTLAEQHDELQRRYSFLWETYTKEHPYLNAWKALNQSHEELKGNYSVLSKKYAELARNQADAAKKASELNKSRGADLLRLQEELKASGAKISELSAQVEEKDVMITLLEQRRTSSGGSGNSTITGSLGGITGNFLKSDANLLYGGIVVVVLLVGGTAVYLLRMRRARAGARIVASPAPAAEPAPPEGASLGNNAADLEREIQKEKLRKLLMERLTKNNI